MLSCFSHVIGDIIQTDIRLLVLMMMRWGDVEVYHGSLDVLTIFSSSFYHWIITIHHKSANIWKISTILVSYNDKASLWPRFDPVWQRSCVTRSSKLCHSFHSHKYLIRNSRKLLKFILANDGCNDIVGYLGRFLQISQRK